MDIYAEEVLEHYENPRNYGEMEQPDYEARDSNASCGDMIQMQLKVEKDRIVDVKWKGIGCAISTAAASKLSESLQGRTLKEVQGMSEEELVKQIGFEVNPGRVKCLTLPVRVVRKFLEN